MMGNPIFVETMNAMGGNGIAMGFNELYSALETGVVDGADPVAQMEMGSIGQRRTHGDLARSYGHPASKHGQRRGAPLRLHRHPLDLLAVDHQLPELHHTHILNARDREQGRLVLRSDVRSEGPVPARPRRSADQRVEARTEGDHRHDAGGPQRCAHQG